MPLTETPTPRPQPPRVPLADVAYGFEQQRAALERLAWLTRYLARLQPPVSGYITKGRV